MTTASLLSGRSHHGTKSTRSSRSKATAKRTPKARDDLGVATPPPDLEELRRRRMQYLSVAPELRRRARAASVVKARLDEPSDPQLRPSEYEPERRHRKRKHKSTSSKLAPAHTTSRNETEDYVYGTPQTTQSPRRTSDSDRSLRGASRRASRPKPSRRHTLPTVVEADIVPDDSISQVGDCKTNLQNRRITTRSGPAATSLRPIAETNGDVESITTTSKRSNKRGSTSSLLGIGSLLRRNTAPAVPTAPRLIECLTCASDDVPVRNSAKLACGHRMCHDCLKRIFEMSVKDPAHMPPKCCTADHIPLHHVDRLFDLKFKTYWNRKYQEYNTKNRIYCSAPKCGQWIKPSHIHSSLGRRYAQCPRCATKVCVSCHAKLHRSRECPKDPEMARLVEQAKEKGWQQCYQCHAMVELKEGCNHMTCRCRAEFCMKCGAKWKSCDCPWFNYSQLPDTDRLNEWRVPEPVQMIFRRAFGAANPEHAADGNAREREAPAPRRTGQRRPTYQEELEQRQRQERLDADLARRLQLASLLDDEPQDRRRANADTWGLGNAAEHFMNDNFVQNAANVVMGAFGDASVGRRGERASGRRRRARPSVEDNDPGLAPNFLGDGSVLGARPEH